MYEFNFTLTAFHKNMWHIFFTTIPDIPSDDSTRRICFFHRLPLLLWRIIKKRNAMAQHVVVTDYNPAWEEMFEKEAQVLWDILGDNCLNIQHIGSTAVPGLAAKPIIDIMPIVYDLAEVDKVAHSLIQFGYEYLGEFGIPGRRYLRKGGDERTYQVHIFAQEDTHNIIRHIMFREYLIDHKEERDAYSKLKKELAQKFPYDIEAYCAGKEAFVQDIEKKGMALYEKNLAEYNARQEWLSSSSPSKNITLDEEDNLPPGFEWHADSSAFESRNFEAFEEIYTYVE